jgi:hypothetical protein
MDFNANEARKITDNHEHFSSEIWFMEFKYKLFDKIKQEALKGNNTIRIFCEDWKGDAVKKKYLLFNLESLGYRTILKDEPRENIIISW